ncbi:MAG: hypothetical protein ACTS4Y_00755 [Candidatus Hodgkinia cicadicola]
MKLLRIPLNQFLQLTLENFVINCNNYMFDVSITEGPNHPFIKAKV